MNSSNSEPQLNDVKSAIKNDLVDLLTELRGFKFVTTPVIKFKKTISDERKNMTLFIQIDYVFESIYTTVISNLQKYLGKGSGWIIYSVIDHNINISIYKPLTSCSYANLLEALDHLRKVLINYQNID